MKLVKDIDNNQNSKKISDKEAEEAFKTILSWMGDCLLYTSPSPRDRG